MEDFMENKEIMVKWAPFKNLIKCVGYQMPDGWWYVHKLLERSEKLDWSFEIYNEPELNHGNSHYGERNYVELRACSPAGEDFIMDIDFDVDDPISSFSKSLSDYAENFDIDEHVEKRLPDRGKGGCPSSIKVLVDDAEAIKNMIEELYKLLSSKEGMV